MIVTRGKLTVSQAARPAIVAECVECAAQAIFVVEAAGASVDHRCGTGVVGPTWSLIERPRRTARERADAFVEGGVRTVEQARAALIPPRAELLPRDCEAVA